MLKKCATCGQPYGNCFHSYAKTELPEPLFSSEHPRPYRIEDDPINQRAFSQFLSTLPPSSLNALMFVAATLPVTA
jgi:hypothetical protein